MHRNLSATKPSDAVDKALAVQHQLCDAASKGCLKKVRKLMSNKYCDWLAHREALCAACSHGHLDVVEWMVKYTTVGGNERSLFKAVSMASDNNKWNVSQWLLRNTILGIDDRLIRNLLTTACISSHIEAAKWIVEHTLSQRFQSDLNTLREVLKAACRCRQWDEVKWILSLATVREDERTVRYALRVARNCNEVSLLLWIIENTFLNTYMKDFIIVLEWASATKNRDALKWNLQNMTLYLDGNEAYSISKALDLACSCRHWDVMRWAVKHVRQGSDGISQTCDKSQRDIMALILTETSLSKETKLSFRSLLSACDSCRWDVVEWMLESMTFDNVPQSLLDGSRLMVEQWVGKQIKLPRGMKVLQNTIYLACEFDQLEFVKWMVEGTKLHTDEKILSSTLHKACCSGKLNVVQCIVNHTAIRRNIASLLIALDVACISNKLPVVSWLTQHTELNSDTILERATWNFGKKTFYFSCWMIDPELSWDVRVLSGTLIKTCFRGQWNVAIWLTASAEIDINQTDYNGNTVLHGAVGFGKDKGQTRLHKACQVGDVAEVWRLSDDDVNAQNNYGDTPLHEACRHGFRDIVEALLWAGCDLSMRNDNGHTPAQHVLAYNHGELLTLLEAHTRLTQTSPSQEIIEMSFRSLLSACDSSQWDVVKKMLESTTFGIPPQYMLENGRLIVEQWANKQKKLPQGMKVLQKTINLACESDQLEFLKWMVEGTKLHTDVEILVSILHKACRSGKLNVMQWIVNQTSIQQDIASLLIALDVACINNKLPLVSWLIQYIKLSSDTILEDAITFNNNHSRLDVSCWTVDPVLPSNVRLLSGTMIKTCFRGQWNVATWLAANAEIDINQTDSNGNTVLHGAVGFGKDKGHTRLHKACQVGDVAEVWRLSDDDDVNAQNNYGDTPLHEACRHGYRDIVEVLVRNGCDLSIRNDNGHTPAQHALWLNHGELLTLLEAHKKLTQTSHKN